MEEIFCQKNLLPCEGYILIDGLTVGENYRIQIASSDNNFGTAEGDFCLHILDKTSQEDFNGIDLVVEAMCVSDGVAEMIVNATGGSGILTFTGTENGTMLNSGDEYMVIVSDENGCEKSAIGVVECGVAPCLLAADATINNASCFGESNGTIALNVQNFTEPLAINWSNGASGASVDNLSAGNYTVTIIDAASCSMITDFEIMAPTILVANSAGTSETNDNANDGSVSVDPQGGATPYTYSWSNGSTNPSQNNLAPGIYMVTVEDANGCTVVESATVASFNCVFAVNVNVANVSCNGADDGIAAAVIQNGTAPYTYEWSTGSTDAQIVNLVPGVYNLTATDANNCPFTATAVVNEPAILAAAITDVGNVSCFGQTDGFANTIIAGGTGPFTYAWSNGTSESTISNLVGGEYTLTVTDANDCSTTAVLNVLSPPELGSYVAFQTDVLCNGNNNGFATVYGTGGTGAFTYQWNDPDNQTTSSVNNLSAGNYMVTITDENNCMTTQEVIIGEPEMVFLDLDEIVDATDNLLDGSIEITVEGGQTPYTYQWIYESVVISEEEDVFNLAAGEYTVEMTDANGCVIIETFTVQSTVDVEKLSDVLVIALQPNPTPGAFMLLLELTAAKNVQVAVFDITGKLIERTSPALIQQQQFTFDLSDYADGIYPVRIIVDDVVITRRVVLTKIRQLE